MIRAVHVSRFHIVCVRFFLFRTEMMAKTFESKRCDGYTCTINVQLYLRISPVANYISLSAHNNSTGPYHVHSETNVFTVI